MGRALVLATTLALAASTHGSQLANQGLVPLDPSSYIGGPYFGSDSSSCWRWTTGEVGFGNLCRDEQIDGSSGDCETGFVCRTNFGSFVSSVPVDLGDPDGFVSKASFGGGAACTHADASAGVKQAELFLYHDNTMASGFIGVFGVEEPDGDCFAEITFVTGPNGITFDPTLAPTHSPTTTPTKGPTTVSPTSAPTSAPTRTPSNSPTVAPTSESPTHSPTTAGPTAGPTPTPSSSPTESPTSSTLQAEYDAIPVGARPSQSGLTWATICRVIGPETTGCPAYGKYEWCDEDFPYFDAVKVDNLCQTPGVTVRNGKCYTCKPTGPRDVPVALT